jgi:hypothetical protein
VRLGSLVMPSLVMELEAIAQLDGQGDGVEGARALGLSQTWSSVHHLLYQSC